MADNPLTKLPLGGQLGVSVLLAALIGGGFYYFFWSPTWSSRRATKKAELEHAPEDIRASRSPPTSSRSSSARWPLREAKLETLKRILPADKETPGPDAEGQYLAAPVET